jgi:ABC-type glycerol-3-phosphate transport system substrate-binding protein
MDKKYIVLIVLGGLIVILGIVYFVFVNKPAPVTGPTELTVVSSVEEEKYLKEIIKEFEVSNNAKINFINKDVSNYETESLNMIATGDIDVWGIPNSWIYKHINKLSPYSDSSSKTIENYNNKYPQLAVDENIYNNKIYGYPLSFDSLVLFRSQNALNAIVEANNISKDSDINLIRKIETWEDLEAQIPLLRNKLNIGLIGAGRPEQNTTPDILSWMLLQQGTYMTNVSNNQAIFHTSANALQGPDYPGAIALNRLANFSSSYPDNLGDPVKAFEEGKLVYLIDYSNKADQFKANNPKLEFESLSVPQLKQIKNVTDFVKYETLTVPQSSKNSILAWKFITFLQNPEYLQIHRTLSKENTFYNNNALSSDVTYKTLENTKNWHNPDKIATDKIFINTISDTLAGKSAQTALDGAAVEVTKLLEKLQ